MLDKHGYHVCQTCAGLLRQLYDTDYVQEWCSHFQGYDLTRCSHEQWQRANYVLNKLEELHEKLPEPKGQQNGSWRYQ